MRYHDFHLGGYEVRKFGGEIVLHLICDSPSTPREESHIRFENVLLYHFVHLGSAIIFGIDEVHLAQILDEYWPHILNWERQHGGVFLLQRHDRVSYQSKLEADGYRAWEISSSVGFVGFVIAKSVADATGEFTWPA